MSQRSIGERLRSAREAIPASMYQASRETKIRVDFLENMEEDNFTFLTGAAYVKGLLRSYSRWLNLDDQQLAQDFEAQFGSAQPPAIENLIQEPTGRMPRGRRPAWMVAALVAATMLLGLSLVGLLDVSDVAPPPSPAREDLTAQVPPSGTAQEANLPAVTAEGVHMTVAVVSDKSWVSVFADGAEQPVFERTLSAGATRTFDAKDQIRVVIGNAGAVRITLNGRDLGPAGELNQTARFTFTPTSQTLRG
ncbi:MAG TPA: RodZ domain-containing protein [Actinomycetota bacterium]|nr:RodZ domain-containing protein [Actinomycetota bacterium]